MQKILIYFLTTIVFISISFFSLFSYLYQNNVREIVADEMENNLGRINEYLNLVFDNTRSVSSALMSNDILQRILIHNWDSAQDLYTAQEFRNFSTLFNDISRANDFIVSTDLYLQDYHILVRSDLGATTRLDEPLINYFDNLTSVNQDFRLADNYNDNVKLYSRRSNNYFTIIRPLYSYYLGEKKGFIAINVNTDTIQRVLKSIQGAQCALLTEKNQLAVQLPYADSILFQNEYFLPPLTAEDSVTFSTFNNVKYIFATTSLKDLPWRLVSYTPIDQLMHKGFRLQNYLIALIISFLLVIGIAAILVMHFINKRIRKLIGLMNQVRSGDFAVADTDIENDEFSYLFHSFQSMAKNLDEMINEIYHLEILHKDAQLHLLQSQINPHFIYNIFNNMHWLLKLKRYDDLDIIIAGVSTFYSRSLNNGKLLIRIDRIMEQINSYIQIQQIRFRNRFSFSMEIEKTLKKEEILNHLIMPLLENSIIHGIEPVAGFFHIKINGFKEQEYLIFTVEDNGAGIPKEELHEISNALKTEGKSEKYFALQNIHKRIQMFYGTDYGLQISSEFGQGTCCKLTLPLPQLNLENS